MAIHAVDLPIVITYLAGMVLVGYLVAGLRSVLRADRPLLRADQESLNFIATVLTSTLLVPVGAALLLRGRRPPLAGALSSCGGLLAVVVFFAVLHLLGIPDADLETRRLPLAGVEILRDYALFFALPLSALGFAAGSILGRRR